MKCQQSKHIFHTQTMGMMNKAITLPTLHYLTYTLMTHMTHTREGTPVIRVGLI